ncbi:uncharacterized protein AB9X84_006116 [Acanthopagrus schlegelii]
MGAVEISVDEDWTLKVVQRYDLRPVLRRLRPEGFERHRVFTWPTCSSVKRPDSCRGLGDVEEAKFNRALKVVLIIVLCLGAVSILFYEQLVTHGYWSWDDMPIGSWLSGCFEIGLTGTLILAVFAAVLVVSELAKYVMEKACSAPPRREEVQTVSAFVQQV